MKDKHSSESGQIIILLVLVIIGLLGFTALAIDGGMIFADRRYEQSAADASSLAGAGAAADVIQLNSITYSGWNCSSTAISVTAKNAAINAAIASADVNDFVILDDPALNTAGHDHGVKITCFQGEGINSDYLDVEVMLSRVTNTSFVHLFTGGEMRNTVYSKTRVRPLLKAGMGSAIVGLGKVCDKVDGGGVHFWGNSYSDISGGGVYSNDCIREGGSSTVDISGGSVTFHQGTRCDITDPACVPDSSYHPLTDTELYPGLGDRCNGLPNYGHSTGNIDPATGDGEIFEGNYTSWEFNDPVALNPGLYCITGVVRMNAGGEVFNKMDADGKVLGGVTIYYTGTDITLNGHLDTGLYAPNSPTIPLAGSAVEDVLLYVPPSVTAEIKINGTSGNIFSGTMYAPSSNFKITGTSDNTNPSEFDASIIGNAVWITGDSYLNFVYEEDKDAGWPAYLQVQK